MRLQRLFEMTPAELAFRGRQEVYKAVERLSAPESRRRPICRFRHSPGDAPMNALLGRRASTDSPDQAGALQKLLQQRMAERFFAGVGEHSDALASSLGLDEAALLAQADAVCREKFQILGYGELSFGQPLNWQLDPISGQAAPPVHWSRLDPLAPEQVGDSKVVWELNRHQWLLELGQAWRLTGEDRYAEKFVALVFDWLERNPFAQGINWSSALEVAMRLISWCWALCLFRGAAALDPERFQVLLGALQRHAEFIERNLSRYFSPNTHLTVEALALYYAGTLLPELQGADRWRALGRSVLLEQLPIQVSEAGIYFEQSTRYQYYTVEIYLHFAVLAARNDDALPAVVKHSLAQLLHFLCEVQRPDGTVPQIGDTDGGWLCPLVRREVGDYRGLFATAAVFLGDARLAKAAQSPTPEALLLLGSSVCNDWSTLIKAPDQEIAVSETVPRIENAGGYVIMRSGDGHPGHQLIFDTGPLGCHVSGGHGHADLLSVQCSAYGENYLIDPGTGCYTAGSRWREFFRSTQAHSTIRVDDLDQAETAGPFAWNERPGAELLEVSSKAGSLFAAARHEAYCRLDDPVTHVRRIWFLNETAWLIVDDLLGVKPHQADLRFQFAPLPVAVEAGDWVRARGTSSSLLLKTFASVELEMKLVAGGREPMLGWYSPNYGQHLAAPALNLRVSTSMPLRLATLMLPLRDPDAAPPTVRPRAGNGMLAGLSVSEWDLSIPEFGPMGNRDPAAVGVVS